MIFHLFIGIILSIWVYAVAAKNKDVPILWAIVTLCFWQIGCMVTGLRSKDKKLILVGISGVFVYVVLDWINNYGDPMVGWILLAVSAGLVVVALTQKTWTMSLIVVVVVSLVYVGIPVYNQIALHQRIMDAGEYLNEKDAGGAQYEPYYLSTGYESAVTPSKENDEIMTDADYSDSTLNEEETEEMKRTLCEEDCREMFEKGDLKQGVSEEDCIKTICKKK